MAGQNHNRAIVYWRHRTPPDPMNDRGGLSLLDELPEAQTQDHQYQQKLWQVRLEEAFKDSWTLMLLVEKGSLPCRVPETEHPYMQAGTIQQEGPRRSPNTSVETHHVVPKPQQPCISGHSTGIPNSSSRGSPHQSLWEHHRNQGLRKTKCAEVADSWPCQLTTEDMNLIRYILWQTRPITAVFSEGHREVRTQKAFYMQSWILNSQMLLFGAMVQSSGQLGQ